MPKTDQELRDYIEKCKRLITPLSPNQLKYAEQKNSDSRLLICTLSMEQLLVPIRIAKYKCNLSSIVDKDFKLLISNHPANNSKPVTLDDLSFLEEDELSTMNERIQEIKIECPAVPDAKQEVAKESIAKPSAPNVVINSPAAAAPKQEVAKEKPDAPNVVVNSPVAAAPNQQASQSVPDSNGPMSNPDNWVAQKDSLAVPPAVPGVAQISVFITPAARPPRPLYELPVIPAAVKPAPAPPRLDSHERENYVKSGKRIAQFYDDLHQAYAQYAAQKSVDPSANRNHAVNLAAHPQQRLDVKLMSEEEMNRQNEENFKNLKKLAAKSLNLTEHDPKLFAVLTTAILNLVSETKEYLSIQPDHAVDSAVNYSVRDGRLCITDFNLTDYQWNDLYLYYCNAYPNTRVTASVRGPGITFDYRQFVDEIMPRASTYFLKRQLDTIAIFELKKLLPSVNNAELIGVALLKYGVYATTITKIKLSDFDHHLPVQKSKCYMVIKDQNILIAYPNLSYIEIVDVVACYNTFNKFVGYNGEVKLFEDPENNHTRFISFNFDLVVSKLIPAFIKSSKYKPDAPNAVQSSQQMNKPSVGVAPPLLPPSVSVLPLLLPPSASAPPAPLLANPGTFAHAFFAASHPSKSGSASDGLSSSNECVSPVKSSYYYGTSYFMAVVGSKNSGKTCLISRYINNRFPETVRISSDVQQSKKTLRIDEALMINDIPGDDAQSDLRRINCIDMDIIVLVCNLTDFRSVEYLYQLNVSDKSKHNPNVRYILVATHADLESQRAVSQQELESVAKVFSNANSNPVPIIKLSTKTGENFNLLSDKITQLLTDCLNERRLQRSQQIEPVAAEELPPPSSSASCRIS